MKTFFIRQAREEKGWTLEYVAQIVGTTNQAVSLIETGKRKPSYEVMVKLENLFGVGHRQLFAAIGGESEQSRT